MERPFPFPSELGLDLQAHEALVAHDARLAAITHRSAPNRPRAMAAFDRSFDAAHTTRPLEVLERRRRGEKIIGTYCIFVPDEIALALGVLPVPLCGGSHWPTDHADARLPREICPLIRSSLGMAFSHTCPYHRLTDAVIGETTCDAKKKTWELMGFTVMEVPHRRSAAGRQTWREEIGRFVAFLEQMTGTRLEAEPLHRSIALMNGKRRLLQQINDFRMLPEPPISGLDALLVSQVALSQDVGKFLEDGCILRDELAERASRGECAYAGPGPRIVLAGTPSPLGHAKVHYALERAGLRIVADESCTGTRYFSGLVDEGPEDLQGMLDAIAARYLGITCACFTPNDERITGILDLVTRSGADGVVQQILIFCHGYNVEAGRVERALHKQRIPSLKLVTDYSFEDIEQMSVRAEAFRDLLEVHVR